MNFSFQARLLAYLILLSFIAIGFKAAEVLRVSWWWSFPLGYLIGGFLFIFAIAISTFRDLDK
jgi:uncharacterized integral membrane protein